MAATKKITKDFGDLGWDDFINYAKMLSLKDNLVWIGSYAFGRGWFSGYRIPSQIPYNAVGDTSFNGTEGYYKNGIHHEFSSKKKIKYNSSCLGCE